MVINLDFWCPKLIRCTLYILVFSSSANQRSPDVVNQRHSSKVESESRRARKVLCFIQDGEIHRTVLNWAGVFNNQSHKSYISILGISEWGSENHFSGSKMWKKGSLLFSCHKLCKLCKQYCSSQPSMVHWLSSSIFPFCRPSVRPSRYGDIRPNLHFYFP